MNLAIKEKLILVVTILCLFSGGLYFGLPYLQNKTTVPTINFADTGNNTLTKYEVDQYVREKNCIDILAQIKTLPKELELIECDFSKTQRPISVKYKVSGSEARIVEQFLQKEFHMAKLVFLCCGWEPQGGNTGYFEIAEYEGLNITMYSEETLIKDHKEWNKITSFYVEADVVYF